MAPRSKAKLHQLASLLPENTVISDMRKQSFVIEKQFAKGGFGRIYCGHQENNAEFGKSGCLAIKVEPQANGPLFTEINVFQRILRRDLLRDWMKKKELKHLGLPPHLSSGIFTHKGEKLRFLVMPKYGRSLENYRIEVGGSLGVFDALTVARQCSDCFDYMQGQDYVHSDLKADNILLSACDSIAECYLVDFGLARMAKTNVEKADKKRAHNGTALFTSLDAHRGFLPSWRGDLEILAYNILYWITGSLPWQNFESQLEKVLMMKEQFSNSYEKEVLSTVADPCGKHLVKLFAIAYETGYLSKIDYNVVNEILDVALKSCKSKPSFPSTARRQSAVGSTRRSEIGKVPDVALSVASTSGLVNHSATPLIPSPRVRKTLAVSKVRKVRAPPKTSTTVKSPRSPLKSAVATRHISSSRSPVVIPGLARWKSPVNIAKVRDVSDSVRSASSKRKQMGQEVKEDKITVPAKRSSPNSPEEDEEIKLKNESEADISTNKNRRASRVASGKAAKPFRKPAAPRSPLHIVPSGRSPEVALESAVAAVIPGVRNMKKIRRSLCAAVLKKYINAANKPHPRHVQSSKH